MQLSKLEIKGFKSFGDKVTVNFDKGITGIVGPNGCGKSNIVDAIRWVLGEQKTKALRSDKMESVIFNGTKKRKALQMSEVSLTFNNTKNLIPTEYSQVTITRRYYRSGESEYLLNGVTCRLKDIIDLFLDTGIGPDSYAIIELKMVDEILNDTNNSRRILFEEASGISKFKKRKKQTLKKLEDTDKDLERVEDVLYEIEKNLKSLERQAKQAEKYRSIKEEYKSLSIQLAKLDLEGHKDEFQKLEQQINELTELKASSSNELGKKEAEIEKLKIELIKKEKLLGSRQKTLNEHVNKIRQFESDKKIRGERLKFLQDKSSSMTEQLSQDRSRIETLNVEIEALSKEKEASEQILNEIKSELEDLRKGYEVQKETAQRLKAELTERTASQVEARDEVFQFKKSTEITETQINSLKTELSKADHETSSQADQINSLNAALKTLTTKLKTETDKLQEIKNADQQNDKAIDTLRVEIETIKDELAKTNRSLDSTENEFKLTKSLVDNLEGFPEAIKFLSKHEKWRNQAVLLSDIISCDEVYKVAIENYLESHMNYYVVDDVAEAYQAVNLLNDSSKGKANFFISKSFEDYKLSKTASIKNATPALAVVEYENQYEKLIHYLLKDVYILNGEHDSVPDDRTEIFLSKSGHYTKKKHTLSGGSIGLFEGKKIGRVKSLEKLQKKIKELSQTKQKTKTALEKKQKEEQKLRASDFKGQIEISRKTLRELEQDYVSKKTKIEQLDSLINSNTDKKTALNQNIEILSKKIEESQPKLLEKEQELVKYNQDIEQLTEQNAHQNEILAEHSTNFNNKNIQLHQQTNKISSTEKEIVFKRNALDGLIQRIDKNHDVVKGTDQEIKKLLESTDDSDEELLSFYEEKESIEAGVNEVEKEYYATRGAISEQETTLKNLNKNKDNTDEVLFASQNKLNELKLSLNSVRERMSVEFNVNLDQLLIEESTEDLLDKGNLLQAIEDVKGKIDKMGPINPMAVEAYEEIKERYDFILEQKSDLVNAKKSLIETITEIDTVAKENFLSSFDTIKNNFQTVFRSLFTDDDTCNLKLSDPSDPLESAIEITAKPKGKKPLSINQLSGGEKTLTAVALLFSIYLLKPAPFCIFDEVDAPLDDANIDKFNNIIRQFSNESQFILVTHNKRTMSTTDIIYGVTMQEAGVSKLVPVDLRSLPDD